MLTVLLKFLCNVIIKQACKYNMVLAAYYHRSGPKCNNITQYFYTIYTMVFLISLKRLH